MSILEWLGFAALAAVVCGYLCLVVRLGMIWNGMVEDDDE